MKSRFIVLKDRPDQRDLTYKSTGVATVDQVDLRLWASPIEDQLRLGSCVGQSVVGAYELMVNKRIPTQFVDLSRLFVYYNSRALDNSTRVDEGAFVRDGIKSLNKWGVCSEYIWPYLIDTFADAPSIDAYVDAITRIVSRYYRLYTLEHILEALNSGFPVVSSMDVYNGFEELDTTSLLRMPKLAEGIIGGHAVTIVGYNKKSKIMIVRNSFGTAWGDDGYFYVPFDYIEKHFMDHWIFDINIT